MGAGIGTYYDFNCGNKSNPGVGCNAYGKPLCRTCTFNKTHTKSHSICPNIPCLNKTKTVEHVFLGAVVPHTWDQCGGSPPYAEDCYKLTTEGDKMAGIGTYYDFNCGNKSNPGVGCNAYGKPLCRTCTFNKTHTKSHSICPNIPCLNKTKTVADNASDDQ